MRHITDEMLSESVALSDHQEIDGQYRFDGKDLMTLLRQVVANAQRADAMTVEQDHEKTVVLEDGKYVVVYDEKSIDFYAKRHGERWRDMTGDKLVFAMFQAIIDMVPLTITSKQQRDKAEAFDQCIEKTEWVQETLKTSELGLHRADIMKRRLIDALTQLEDCRETLRAHGMMPIHTDPILRHLPHRENTPRESVAIFDLAQQRTRVGIVENVPCPMSGCTNNDGKPCAYAECPNK